MTPLQTVAARIGSPDAVSWPVFWATLAAGAVGNTVTNAGAPAAVRLVALLLGQAALWVPLALIWAALRRDPGRPRPLLVLATAFVGLMFRATVIGWVMYVQLGPTESRWGDRFASALLNIGMTFVVAAYLVSVTRERRRQILRLEALNRQLATTLADVDRQISERRNQMLTEVQSVLVAELDAIDPAAPARSVESLRRTASTVIRPLSHRLALANSEQLPAPTTGPTAVSWSEVLDEVATGRPFQPRTSGLLFGLEALAATVAYPRGAPLFASLVLLLTSLLLIANAALERALRGRSRGIRWTLVISAAVMVGAVLASVTLTATESGRQTAALAFGAAFFAVVFTLGTAVAASVGRDRKQMINRLQETSQLLERRLVRGRQVRWLQEKGLARALHGPVQSAVTAAALRLDSAVRADSVQPTLLEAVRRQLSDALGVLASPTSDVVHLDHALKRIGATWDGLCVVSSQVTIDADELLAADAVLRSTVIDILTEASSNAVRHDGTTHLSIDIGRNDDDLLLRVTGNAHHRGAAGQPGLGSRVLDDCTLQWHLDRQDRTTSLVAVLPVPEN